MLSARQFKIYCHAFNRERSLLVRSEGIRHNSGSQQPADHQEGKVILRQRIQQPHAFPLPQGTREMNWCHLSILHPLVATSTKARSTTNFVLDWSCLFATYLAVNIYLCRVVGVNSFVTTMALLHFRRWVGEKEQWLRRSARIRSWTIAASRLHR